MIRRASWLTLPVEGLIRLYQYTLARVMGGQCRFEPTCSHYGLEAYRQHGLWRGTVLTMRRVGRCNPFSKGGYDPVPVPESHPRPNEADLSANGRKA